MSPARKRINEVIKDISLDNTFQRTLFVGVDKKWDYRKLFFDYSTIDINPKLKPDILGDIQNCPEIPSKSFDLVIMTGVYEYLQKPDLAFKEIYRILRPKGTALLCIDGFAYYHGTKPYMNPSDIWYHVKPLTLQGFEVVYYRDAFVPYYFIIKATRWN